VNLATVLSQWTVHMYDRHHALHHLDVMAGAWAYRVFLLPNTLHPAQTLASGIHDQWYPRQRAGTCLHSTRHSGCRRGAGGTSARAAPAAG
jgi:hypothetical protein